MHDRAIQSLARLVKASSEIAPCSARVATVTSHDWGALGVAPAKRHAATDSTTFLLVSSFWLEKENWLTVRARFSYFDGWRPPASSEFSFALVLSLLFFLYLARVRCTDNANASPRTDPHTSRDLGRLTLRLLLSYIHSYSLAHRLYSSTRLPPQRYTRAHASLVRATYACAMLRSPRQWRR